MKITCLCLSLFLSAVVSSGQTYVHSVLPNNGSAVYTQVISTASTVAPPAPVVFVGHFSKPLQTVDDILTFQQNADGSVSSSCLLNGGDTTFSQPVITSVFPASALPLTAFKFIPSSTQSTDSIFVGNNTLAAGQISTSILSTLAFSGCVPTVQSVALSAGWPADFSNTYNTQLSINCGGHAISGQTVLGIVDDVVWVFSSSGGVICPGLAPLYASFAVPGPFSTLSSTNNYQFSLVTEEPPSSLAPAVFNLVDSTLGLSNWTNLEGQIFLGWIFAPDGIVAVSSTGSQVFFDLVTVNAGQPAITNVGTQTLSAPPVGMVLGNFANDSAGNDVAVAAGSTITLFEYVGSAGHPLWSLSQTLQASAPIQALATGNLSSLGDEVTAQEGSNVEIFSLSGAFTVAPPAPPPMPVPTFTLVVQTAGSPGNVSQSPAGVSFAAGAVITLNETPGTGSVFSGWSGACSGTQPVCTVQMTADESVTATFTAAPTPALTATPPATTIAAGASANYQLTPTGFSTTPILSVSGCQNIQKATCQIISGALVVTTTAASTSAALMHVDWYRLPGTGALLAVLCLLALLVPFQPRRRLVLGSACLLVLAGCGGSASKPAPTPQTISGTPAGTYSLVTTASAGNTTASTTVSLQVK